MSQQHPARKPSGLPEVGSRSSEISAIRPALPSLPPGRIPSIPPSGPGLGPKKRVLLIEPSPADAQVHLSMLSAWFEVVIQANPLEVLDQLALVDTYALVLCNVETPTISGFEFVRR